MKITKAIQILDHALKNGYEYLHTEDGDMAVRSAIEALSRQVAKEPEVIVERMSDDDLEYDLESYYCQTCGNTLVSDNMIYCPNCGQKIDWGEDDDDSSNN